MPFYFTNPIRPSLMQYEKLSAQLSINTLSYFLVSRWIPGSSRVLAGKPSWSNHGLVPEACCERRSACVDHRRFRMRRFGFEPTRTKASLLQLVFRHFVSFSRKVSVFFSFFLSEAQLAASLLADKRTASRVTVHSFDLVAANARITACDIANVCCLFVDLFLLSFVVGKKKMNGLHCIICRLLFLMALSTSRFFVSLWWEQILYRFFMRRIAHWNRRAFALVSSFLAIIINAQRSSTYRGGDQPFIWYCTIYWCCLCSRVRTPASGHLILFFSFWSLNQCVLQNDDNKFFVLFEFTRTAQSLLKSAASASSESEPLLTACRYKRR